MKDLILTVDVGTGSARTALVTPKGEIIGLIQKEYDQTTPHPGWTEQQPSLWWNNVSEGIKELLTDFSEYRSRIGVIASCGQMHGTVLLDSNGKLVIDKALLWNDKRNEKQVCDFIKEHDTHQFLSHLNNPATTAWPAFKLAWIQENWPESWAKTAMMLMPKDFINFRLTGVTGTDYSEASCFYLMDSQTKDYSMDMLGLFNIQRSQLPNIYESTHILGYVHHQASLLTGLPEGIPVITGTADMAATLLGSGVYEQGVASDSTGTSTLLTVVAEKPLLGDQLNNLHLANKVWGGFTILDAGGDAMRWARTAMHDNTVSYQKMMAEASKSPVGAGGLFFLPYLTGERNALKKNSRAQYFGLTRKHRSGDLYRAILEGVAFASAMNLSQLEQHVSTIDSVIASGGGSKDKLWLSIKSAIYNKPIIKTKGQENGIQGCAILGATAIGLYNNIDEATKAIVDFDYEVTPDSQLSNYYLQAKEVFNRLYTDSQKYYDELDRLAAMSRGE